MKSIIVLIFLLINVSSFAQKVDYDVVNDLVETELSKMDHDTIFVIQQPLDKIETLNLYEIALKEKMSSVAPDLKQVWVSPEYDAWPLDKKNIDEIRNNLLKEKREDWVSKDFKNRQFIIFPEKKIRSKDFIIKHITGNNRILNLSRPIYNKDKTYALLQFYPSFLIGGAASENSGVMLMKKEKDKWVQIALFQYAVYH